MVTENIEKFNKLADARENLKCPYGLSFVSWYRCTDCPNYYRVPKRISKCLLEDIRNYIYYQIEKGDKRRKNDR